jgi:hypothetical protein
MDIRDIWPEPFFPAGRPGGSDKAVMTAPDEGLGSGVLLAFTREAHSKAEGVRERSRVQQFPNEIDLRDLAHAVHCLCTVVERLIQKTG